MTRWLRCCSVLALCLAFAGCSVLTPVADQSRYFNLAAMPSDQASARATASLATYGIGPINLPAYLDRNEIATRVSPTEVKYSSSERWAEPLPTTFSSVLLQNLALLLHPQHISPYPGADPVDYQIQIDVVQFDNDDAGNARLLAHWRIKNTRSGAFVVGKESDVALSRASKDTNTRVAALSDAVRDLAQDIASAAGDLPQPAAPGSAAMRRK